MVGRRKKLVTESDGGKNQLSLRTSARRLSMMEGEASTSPLTPPPADAAPARVEQRITRGSEKGNGRRRDSDLIEGVPSKKKPKITFKVPPTDDHHQDIPGEVNAEKSGQTARPTSEISAADTSQSKRELATSAPPTNQTASPPGRSADLLPLISVSRPYDKKATAELPVLPALPLHPSDPQAGPDTATPASSSTLTSDTPTTLTKAETKLPGKTSQESDSKFVETVKRGAKSRMAESDTLSAAGAELDRPTSPVARPNSPVASSKAEPAVVKRSAKSRRVDRVIRSPEPDVAEEKTKSLTGDKRRTVEPSQSEKTLEEDRPAAIVKETRKKNVDIDFTPTKTSKVPSAYQLVERSSPALLSPAHGESAKNSPPKAPRTLPKVIKRPGIESAKLPLKSVPTEGERKVATDIASVKRPIIATKKVPAPIPAVPSLLQGTLAALQGVGQSKPKLDVGKQVRGLTSILMIFNARSPLRTRRRLPKLLVKTAGRANGS